MKKEVEQIYQIKDRILSIKDLMQILNLGRTTIYSLLKRGEFPAPLRLSPRRIGWRISQIEEWLDKKLQKSYKGRKISFKHYKNLSSFSKHTKSLLK